jgi:hypothetical protein
LSWLFARIAIAMDDGWRNLKFIAIEKKKRKAQCVDYHNY